MSDFDQIIDYHSFMFIPRLYGSYTNIIGGEPVAAFEDFTGGIAEVVYLKGTTCSGLFGHLVSLTERASLIGAAIRVSFQFPHSLTNL